MVKSIYLQDGEEIFVDDEDYEKVNQYLWYKSYDKNTRNVKTHSYINNNEESLTIYQVIKPKSTQIEKNNDFRKSNLTDENIHFYSLPRHNQKSKYKGVSWSSETNKWLVSMQIDGKQKRLGRYTREEDAAKAYNEALDKYRNGKGFRNVIGVDNRNKKRTYKTTKNQINTRIVGQKNYRGVTNRAKKFEVRKRIFGENIYIGRYESDVKAALVFNKVVLYLYGNEAILNDVPITDELKEFIDNWEIPEKIKALKEGATSE